MARVAGIFAAVLVAAGLAWYFLSPPSLAERRFSSDDRPLVYGGEARAVLAGQVQFKAGVNAYDDAGALILLRRVDDAPPQKVLAKTIYRYLNEASVAEKFPHPWMHAARTSETGRFRIGIDAPGQFEVLIISASKRSTSSLTSADEQQLATWLDAPRELIGKHPYKLVQQRVDKSEVQLNEVFQLDKPPSLSAR
jgi:hypothetical protein